MRFVKVNCIKNGEMYIDVEKIITLFWNSKEEHTVLRFHPDYDSLRVKETPEDILTKLTTIGG